MGDLVSLDVGIVVVHVASTLDDGKLETEIVAESFVVAAFGHLVAFLYLSESLIQRDNLVAGFAKSTFSITQGEAFVKRSDSRRHLEQWKLLQDNDEMQSEYAYLYILTEILASQGCQCHFDTRESYGEITEMTRS